MLLTNEIDEDSNDLDFNRFPIVKFAIAFIHVFSGSFTGNSVYQNLPVSPKGDFVYGSYQNRTVCYSEHSFQHPSTLDDIQKIVHAAIAFNTTLRPLGSIHTDTELICTKGVPVSMKMINFVLLNEDNTATIGAGTELSDALEELHRYGRTLTNMPSFGAITIGGLLGCASHGSSLIHPGLTDQLVGITFVDGTGKIHYLTKPEDLNPFKANLGFLGIVYSATFTTSPLFKMRIHNYHESEELLFNGDLLKMARRHDMFQFWWFPSDRSVVISKGDFISESTFGNATTYFIPEVDKNLVATTRNFMEIFHELKDLRGMALVEKLTKQSLYGYTPRKPVLFSMDEVTLSNPAVGYGHRLMANRCKGHKCPWDLYPVNSGVSMDVSETIPVAKTIQSILKESPSLFPYIGFYFRFSTPSNGLMTIESDRETVHLEWVEAARFNPFEKPRSGIGAHQAMMQALIHYHDGRIHWAKNGAYYFSDDIFKRRGANLYKFREYMKLYDPLGIFLNPLGKRLLGISNDIPMDPREKYCALNDHCICQSDEDCGSTKDVRCLAVLGFNVCQKMETTDIINYVNKEL